MTTAALQSIKERIDGFHCLQADGHLSDGDCCDAIGALLTLVPAEQLDEVHEYKWESFCKFGLNN